MERGEEEEEDWLLGVGGPLGLLPVGVGGRLATIRGGVPI